MNGHRLCRMSERTYERAIEILNSRRRLHRPVSASPRSSPGHDVDRPTPVRGQLHGSPSIAGMGKWLTQLGHEAAEINRLNVVHVAGTKGKGSTCAFTESFLRSYGERTGFPSKTGLYTSPHLIFPEERIRIDFRPISRRLFTKYFFEVWNSLLHDAESQPLPRYLQLLALTAFHTFIMEKAPLVTIITPLGMDHVQQLGPTLEDIAWHKSGIFKSGAYALSAPQDDGAADVLRKRASEKGVSLVIVKDDAALPVGALQLKPDVQKANCSLALAGTRAFMEAKHRNGQSPLLVQDVKQGVARFMWPGRFQIVVEGRFHWYLDGAHNEMSVVKAAEWYTDSAEAGGLVKKVLIFGHVSDTRDATKLVTRLAQALSMTRMDLILFTHYEPDQAFHRVEDIPSSTSGGLDPATMSTFEAAWKNVDSCGQILLKQNIKDAMETVRAMEVDHGSVRTLITGSQHLVGGALFYLDSGRQIASSI